MSTSSGSSGRLGLEIEFRAELAPVDQIDPCFQERSSSWSTAAQSASSRRPPGRPAAAFASASDGWGVFGPDLADDMSDLLVVEPLGSSFGVRPRGPAIARSVRADGVAPCR